MDIYEVSRFGTITARSCTGETKDFYTFFDGGRSAKRSQWNNYFPSWQEAKQFIVEKREQELASAKRKTDICRSHLEVAKALKPITGQTESSAPSKPEAVKDDLPMVSQVGGD